MANVADTVLKTFRAQKFDSKTQWDLKKILLHRLVASFIWLRANTLATRQNLSVDATVTEVTKELTQVKALITDLLGTDNHSGSLGSAQDLGTPGHLDLADVAKQRTTDLGPVEKERAAQIKKTQNSYIRDRRKQVLAIVWRAAALEFELWEDTSKNLRSLDTIALKELLDRRLRAVERLHVHVGPESPMVSTVATLDSGWLDGMRVRLFQYPSCELAGKLKATVTPDIGTKWVRVKETPPDEPEKFNYAVMPSPATRQYNGNPTDTQPLTSFVAWRFPSAMQANWVVSQGKDSGYRIDFAVPVGTPSASDIIDTLFAYQGLIDNAPEKADLWNRAWLLCDHVLSAIQIEALLFGLRRSAIATNQPISTANAMFNSIVSLKPTLTVHRLNSEGDQLKTTATVIAGFVSLDGHLQSAGMLAQSYVPDPKVLMNSREPDAATFADLYFRNRIGDANELQIGDQVKIFSNPVYTSLQPAGVWSLENALVTDIDPDVANPNNRGGLRIDSLVLEGHGLPRLPYPDFRTALGKGLTMVIADTRDRIFNTNQRPVYKLNVGDPAHKGVPLVEWAPYSVFNTIRVNYNDPSKSTEDIRLVNTGPWWVALSLRDFVDSPTDDPDLVTPEQALAKVPGAIGKFHVLAYGLKGDPTTGNLSARQKLGLSETEDLFDHFILFPLVEPRVKSKKGASSFTWSDLFFFKHLGMQNLDNITFRMLVADQKVIPGFTRTVDPAVNTLNEVPMIQPRPRRST